MKLTIKLTNFRLHKKLVEKLSVPTPTTLPDEVRKYLDMYGLPPTVASTFICPKHYQLWFIPKLGNTEKAFFYREEF